MAPRSFSLDAIALALGNPSFKSFSINSSRLSNSGSFAGAAAFLKYSASLVKSEASSGLYCFSQPCAKFVQRALISNGDSSLISDDSSITETDLLSALVAASPCFSNSSFVAPQRGQTQSSGTSSHRVPGAMPASGMPLASSYMYPQIEHKYFSILFPPSFLFIL